MEGIAQIDFSWKSFLVNVGLEICRFLEALGVVFLTFTALKTGMKTERFFMKSIISRTGSGEGDPLFLSPLKT